MLGHLPTRVAAKMDWDSDDKYVAYQWLNKRMYISVAQIKEEEECCNRQTSGNAKHIDKVPTTTQACELQEEHNSPPIKWVFLLVFCLKDLLT